ncbi:MAG TPA: N-acetylmuramoyl-L-alanine amidase, partial [Moraxellaceae bacterium]|nr:N-acetylmuramoyl-L-alanine amidase [Moraxellaceae bacterium]
MKANLLRRCAALVILFLLVGCSVPPASNNQPPANAPVVQPALVGQGWTIGIDPGHGWKDSSGAVGNGLREDDVTLDIAVRTKAILDKNGFQTFLSRTGYDTVHGLSYAAVAINAGNPDLAVSIHANSSKGTTGDGTEACYMMNTQWDKQSKSLADLLAASVSSELGLRNRGIFPENAGDRCARSNTTGWTQLYFHNFNAPAALIETAFLSNPVEADMLNRRSQDFAQAIADAIMAYVRNAGTPGDVPSGTSVVASTPVVVAGGTPTNT